MVVGDNPAAAGGLARIGRDLATLLSTLPQFRVAYLARGHGNRRKFPFTMYTYPEVSMNSMWGMEDIQSAWEDFAAGERGIIFTTDDPSRRHWFVNPVGMTDELQSFLGPGRTFERWGYFPIDGAGPNGQMLSYAGRDCVNRYDRVLAASEWGCGVLKAGGRKDANWLPHGIFPANFHFHGKTEDRDQLGWKHDNVYVGSVMANQARKDFPALFECFGTLKREYGNQFRAWLHTDQMIGYWSVPALATDYDMTDSLEVTTNATDGELATRYAACDCSVLPSAGEGFGYPIVESLACGTACVVTAYSAGAELVMPSAAVGPLGYRVDTQHNVLRAVLRGRDFGIAAIHHIEKKRKDWEHQSHELAATVDHLNWDCLKHLWIRWFLEGVGK